MRHAIALVAIALTLAGCTATFQGVVYRSTTQEGGTAALKLETKRVTATCVELEPEIRPSYTHSGAWVDGELWLVDPRTERLFAYSPSGEERKIGPIPGVDPWKPQALGERGGNNIVLQVEGRRFYELDGGRVVDTLDIGDDNPPRSGEVSIHAAFQWEVPAGDLLVYTDIKRVGSNEEAWSGAVARIPWGEPDDFVVGHQSDFRSPEWLFGRLGFPYLAGTPTGQAWAYIFGDQPGVFRLHPGGGVARLPELPEELAVRPALPEFRSPAEFAATLAVVERSVMVTGLYADGDTLYVVHREPAGEATTWWLSRLNATTGARVGEPVRLPSSAPHLLVIPGPEYWALVEKGSLEPNFGQEVQQILLVPRRRVEGAHTPLCD